MKSNTTTVLANGAVSAAVAVLISASLLGACSDSDDKEKASTIPDGMGTIGSTDDNTSGQNAGDSTMPRSFINNGYYLTTMQEFESDGSLRSTETHVIDYIANTITQTSTSEFEQILDGIYTYNEQGDIASISYYADIPGETQDPDTGLVETGRSTAIYENDRMISLFNEQLFGNESDSTIAFTYNPDGTLLRSETTLNDGTGTDSQDYTYNNGQLVSIRETDVELPGVVINHIFAMDTEGRLASKTTTNDTSGAEGIFAGNLAGSVETYSYDSDGNLAEIAYSTPEGTQTGREAYTYERADEPVFNFSNLALFYQ